MALSLGGATLQPFSCRTSSLLGDRSWAGFRTLRPPAPGHVLPMQRPVLWFPEALPAPPGLGFGLCQPRAAKLITVGLSWDQPRSRCGPHRPPRQSISEAGGRGQGSFRSPGGPSSPGGRRTKSPRLLEDVPGPWCTHLPNGEMVVRLTFTWGRGCSRRCPIHHKSHRDTIVTHFFQTRKLRQTPQFPQPERDTARVLPGQVALLSLWVPQDLGSGGDGV